MAVFDFSSSPGRDLRDRIQSDLGSSALSRIDDVSQHAPTSKHIDDSWKYREKQMSNMPYIIIHYKRSLAR